MNLPLVLHLEARSLEGACIFYLLPVATFKVNKGSGSYK